MDTKLQDALKRANTEVEKSGITDVELKKIAFSKAVDFYLHNDAGPSVTKNHDHKTARQETPGDSFWGTRADAVDIEEKKLKDVYSLKGDQVSLAIRAIPGEAKADRQRNLGALILLAYNEGRGDEWVSSTLLAEAAKHSGVYDTSKFSGNLTSDWFRTIGAKKGLKYKLSGPGVNHAKSLLKGLTEYPQK